MSQEQTNWSREEFEAYLLFYCANADFVITEEEKQLIHDKVSDAAYENMKTEFEADKDYTRIQKIIHTAERFELTKEEIQTLFNEITELFEADGNVDILEKEVFIGLRRVLK